MLGIDCIQFKLSHKSGVVGLNCGIGVVGVGMGVGVAGGGKGGRQYNKRNFTHFLIYLMVGDFEKVIRPVCKQSSTQFRLLSVSLQV